MSLIPSAVPFAQALSGELRRLNAHRAALLLEAARVQSDLAGVVERLDALAAAAKAYGCDPEAQAPRPAGAVPPTEGDIADETASRLEDALLAEVLADGVEAGLPPVPPFAAAALARQEEGLLAAIAVEVADPTTAEEPAEETAGARPGPVAPDPAPADSPEPPRRRGRPPGRKNKQAPAAAAADVAAQVDEFARTKGITRCPAAMAAPTTATLSAEDRAAISAHVDTRLAAASAMAGWAAWKGKKPA